MLSDVNISRWNFGSLLQAKDFAADHLIDDVYFVLPRTLPASHPIGFSLFVCRVSRNGSEPSSSGMNSAGQVVSKLPGGPREDRRTA